jgi:hypothetical protein
MDTGTGETPDDYSVTYNKPAEKLLFDKTFTPEPDVQLV